MREWAAPFAPTAIWRTPDGRRAGYVEGLSDGRAWHQVLGDEPELVRDVIATIKPGALQQHPNGWLVRSVIDSAWGKADVALRGDALACELQPGALDVCMAEVEQGKRRPGSFIWPLALAVCS